MDLTEREILVFKYLIEHYISQANPVGSETLVKKYSLDISSATVRNVFRSLEKKGLLTQPHISAGRAPTTRGYEFYFQYLLQSDEISKEEKDALTRLLWSDFVSVDQVFHSLTKILAAITQELSVVIAPLRKDLKFRRLDFFKLSEHYLLIIFLIENQPIRSRFIEFSNIPDGETLRGISTRLNERLTGLTLEEIRNSINERLKDIIELREKFLSKLIQASQSIFSVEDEKEIFIGGRVRLLDHPEFDDSKNVRRLMYLLDEREKLIDLVDSPRESKEIDIDLCDDEMNFLSVMRAPFISPMGRGMMGLIGPRRMKYPKFVGILSYASKIVEDVLNAKQKRR